jgi:O-antigen/teichoic acid export membrane protein
MIFFSGFSSIIRYQLLIPDSRDKSFVFSILFGAIINLILNCILIPYYSANGAAIATVVAYLSVLIIQLILTIRDIKYYKILLYIIPFILIGIAMFFFVSFIYKQINNVIISIILSVFAGALLYLFLSFIVLVIYKDEYVFKFFKKIKSRFMRIEK